MIKNVILAATLTAAVAQPAAAGNNDIFNLFVGIIAGAAIADMNNKAQHDNRYYDAQREHRTPRVCYQEVERRGNFVTVYGLDCNGNIITAETRRRNH